MVSQSFCLVSQLFFRFVFLFVFALLPCTGEAAPVTNQPPPLNLTIHTVAKVYEAQKPIQLLLEFQVAPKWHTYWTNPGQVGLATDLEWQLPDGWSLQQVEWPTPESFEQEGIFSFGYEGTQFVVVTLQPSKQALQGSFPIHVTMKGALCNSICVPERADGNQEIQIGDALVSDEAGQALLEKAKKRIPHELLCVEMILSNHEVDLLIPRMPDIDQVLSLRFFPESEDWNEAINTLTYAMEWDKILLRLSLPKNMTHEKGEQLSLNGIVHLSYRDKKGEVHDVAYSIKGMERGKEAVPIETMVTRFPSYIQGIMAPFANKSMWDFILLGFLGGILLNIMPCVLPVIGLKVVHLISSKRLSYGQSVGSAFAYTLGIVSAFWLLTVCLYFLQRANEAYGWGFQLQNPYFVATLIILFVWISANLFGFFGMGYGFAAWAQEKEEQTKTLEKHNLVQSFLSGLLATFVATPCTGPLLGAVIGFASLLSLPKAAILFTSIALGMATPFILIALLPPLAWILPKPGPWMVSFKQCMGFLLLLSIIWLVWVMSRIAPDFTYELFMLGAVLLYFSAWLFGKSQQHRDSFLGKSSFLLFLLSFLIGCMVIVSSFHIPLRTEIKKMVFGREMVFERYSEERLQKELQAGNIVLVNGEARWCLTCQANKIIFANEKVKQYLESKHVVLLEADWTRQDHEVTEWLHSLGRNGVPTIALYKKGKEPVLLPELISPDVVKNGIDSIAKETP